MPGHPGFGFGLRIPGIKCILFVSIETGGPRIILDPWLWVGCASDSSTASVGPVCRLVRTWIGYSEGDLWANLSSVPSLTYFSWA